MVVFDVVGKSHYYMMMMGMTVTFHQTFSHKQFIQLSH